MIPCSDRAETAMYSGHEDRFRGGSFWETRAHYCSFRWRSCPSPVWWGSIFLRRQQVLAISRTRPGTERLQVILFGLSTVRKAQASNSSTLRAAKECRSTARSSVQGCALPTSTATAGRTSILLMDGTYTAADFRPAMPFIEIRA